MLKPFLTANWRYLAMLNFAVDSKILAPHVPAGTQLDFHNDKTYLSVVGFLFYDVKPRRAYSDRSHPASARRKSDTDTAWREVVDFWKLTTLLKISVPARASVRLTPAHFSENCATHHISVMIMAL